MRTSASFLGAITILGALLAPANAFVIDQNNSPGNNAALNVNSGIEWQQEVRVGVTGEFVGVNLYCFLAGPVRISIYRGRGWHTGTPDATLDVTTPSNNAFYAFNFESFHLLFNAGDYFTISLKGPNGSTQFGGNKTTPYPYGDIFINGNNFAPYSLTFITYMNVPETPSLNVTLNSELVSQYDAKTTLREALAYATSLGGARTITFDPSLAGQTITLSTGWNDANDTAALRVSTQITLQGLTSFPGVTIAIAQGVQKRHFYIESLGNLTVANLTLSNGNVSDYGGSIWNTGTLNVRACTFTGNSAGNQGGAIQSNVGTVLSVENTTFSGNTAGSVASAIATGAQPAALRYLTITNNSGGGGAILLYQYPTTMIDSIVAGNLPDGIIAQNGGAFAVPSTNNLLGPGGSGGLTNGVNGNQVGVPANQLYLDSLGQKGGPTPTIALQPGSPAVDAGVVVAGLTTDQRGFDRPLGAAVDIGAFELFPTQYADIPIIAPLGGTYENSVQISIAATSTRAIVRYTLDGSDPDSGNGQVYTAPFTLTQSTTVKAIAYGRGWLESPIASVDYTVLKPLPFWRNLQGLAADGSQDLANPSGDGVANLLKYAFNIAPNAGDLAKPNATIMSHDGTAGLPLISRDAQGQLVIEFVRRKAGNNPGIAYLVETGDNLTGLDILSLTNASAVVSIDARWERVVVTDPGISAKRFARVRVQTMNN